MKAGRSSAATAAANPPSREPSAGDLPLLSGQRESHFSRVTRLSFEQLQKLVSDEWQRNNTDLLSPVAKKIPAAPPRRLSEDEVKDPAAARASAEQFGISALLDRRFKYLSTGGNA